MLAAATAGGAGSVPAVAPEGAPEGHAANRLHAAVRALRFILATDDKEASVTKAFDTARLWAGAQQLHVYSCVAAVIIAAGGCLAASVAEAAGTEEDMAAAARAAGNEQLVADAILLLRAIAVNDQICRVRVWLRGEPPKQHCCLAYPCNTRCPRLHAHLPRLSVMMALCLYSRKLPRCGEARLLWWAHARWPSKPWRIAMT